MLAKWTGDVVGLLHVYNIEGRELAKKMGCTPEYLSKLLNGKREPKDAEAKVMTALNELIAEKSKAS